MSERSAYDSGLCCMARHASAVPPWTCDCSCHTRKERDTTPPADLPQRSASELARALRMRANHLSGEAWEVDATAAMMREAADMLSSTPPADYTSDEALQMIGGSEGCGPGSLRELVAAWFDLQARRVEADSERAVLLKALLGVRSPARGYPCWCDESHNNVEHGHQSKCIAALAALRPAPERKCVMTYLADAVACITDVEARHARGQRCRHCGRHTHDDTCVYILLTRALVDLATWLPRAVHLPDCESGRCEMCGGQAGHELHYVATVDSHAYVPRACTCGLDARRADVSTLAAPHVTTT